MHPAGLRAAGQDGGDEPLSFGFLDTVPGERISIGPMRLHLDCREADRPPGTVEADESPAHGPTVLFEAGLGGSSLEWWPVADRIDSAARFCVYDRAGYGWSDPSRQPRHALRLAYELDRLLAVAGIDGPLIVVAHSFGGFVARLLAERRDDIAALVLLDSSHEEQLERLETPGGRLMMPRGGGQFVVSGNQAPENLPRKLRRKVAALNRMRKTYSAIHGEMSAFRESAEQVRAARARRGEPFPFPVTVVRRGRDLYADRTDGAERTAVWIELQEDLAEIGRPGRLVIAEGSGHHLHADDPSLVAAEIERLLEPLVAEGRR